MAAVQQPVTKADIEAKLRQIQGEVESTADSAKSYALVAGIGGTVLLLLLAYFLGRRKGKKKTTLVEIRRI
jgi:LPXTG-motif cell wall-anchored protein